MAINSFSGANRFLSNFFPSPIRLYGIDFPTVEHAYQASKFRDTATRLTIAAAPTPGHAKRAGRHFGPDLEYLGPDWESKKVEVMRQCLELKFQIPHLREMLLDTGDEELIEGNHWGDRFWGVCAGTGENWLGRLLMERRQIVRGYKMEDEQEYPSIESALVVLDDALRDAYDKKSADELQAAIDILKKVTGQHV